MLHCLSFNSISVFRPYVVGYDSRLCCGQYNHTMQPGLLDYFTFPCNTTGLLVAFRAINGGPTPLQVTNFTGINGADLLSTVSPKPLPSFTSTNVPQLIIENICHGLTVELIAFIAGHAFFRGNECNDLDPVFLNVMVPSNFLPTPSPSKKPTPPPTSLPTLPSTASPTHCQDAKST